MASWECGILNCFWKCVAKKIPEKINPVQFFPPRIPPNLMSCKREHFLGTFSIQLHHEDTIVQEFTIQASLLQSIFAHATVLSSLSKLVLTIMFELAVPKLVTNSSLMVTESYYKPAPF